MAIMIHTEKFGTFVAPEPAGALDAKLQSIYRLLSAAHDEFHGLEIPGLADVEASIHGARQRVGEAIIIRAPKPEEPL